MFSYLIVFVKELGTLLGTVLRIKLNFMEKIVNLNRKICTYLDSIITFISSLFTVPDRQSNFNLHVFTAIDSKITLSGRFSPFLENYFGALIKILRC